MRSSGRIQRGNVVGAARRSGCSFGSLPPVEAPTPSGGAPRAEPKHATDEPRGPGGRVAPPAALGADYFDAKREASAHTDGVASPRTPEPASRPASRASSSDDGGAGGAPASPAVPAADPRDSPLAVLLARLADAARHRIVVERAWHFEFSGSRHFDRLAPRDQVCLVGEWLGGALARLPAPAASLQGASFWPDCVAHALLKSLAVLVLDDGETAAHREWRETTLALYAAATDGARAPVDAGDDDPAAWKLAVDCVVAEFLPSAAVRKALSGAVDPRDCADALAAACSGAYVEDVALDAGALLGPQLAPRRARAPADARAANALIAALNHEDCAEADLFVPVGWQAAKDGTGRYRTLGAAEEAARIARVREAVDMMREAERTAGAARETARDLRDAALRDRDRAAKKARESRKPQAKDALDAARRRLRHSEANVEDAAMLWKEQCRTLCEGVGLLLRALVHAQASGWVRAWIDAQDGDGNFGRKLAAFEAAAKPKLACTDAVFAEFAELQDYLVACHSVCASADYLWAYLKCRPGEEEADDDESAAAAAARVDQLPTDGGDPASPRLVDRLEARRAARD